MSAILTIQLFGPLRVSIGTTPMARLRSRKTLWLLALMSLRHNRPVERDWVANTLWPDSDLSVALANLRPVLCELRSALGEHAYRLSSTDRSTLHLDLNGADVDVVKFDEAIRQGGKALKLAVDLYVGPLLEGCPEEWVPQERTAREQDVANALQALGEASLDAGEAGEATDRYQRLIQIDPLREAGHRGLMEALSRSGDVNAALRVYREFADLLAVEIGGRPEESTTALYTELRNHTKRAEAKPTVPKSSPQVLGNLPAPVASLVGREDEVEEVIQSLRRHRLVTLCGTGGIGKTRLALASAGLCASEYPDGAWFIGLDSLSDDRLVVGHLIASLRIPESGLGSSVNRLTNWLKSKRILLVLDNCEIHFQAVAKLCAMVLGECVDVRILATSRQPLGAIEEHVWAVPALTTPEPNWLPKQSTTRLRVVEGYESVRLFVERANSASRSFKLTVENANSVAQICANLEGVPLAIELAAARTKMLSVEQIAEHLGRSQQLGLLTGGDRRGVVRQQTLRATLDWSYQALSEHERLLLQRVSVFTGGWTSEAAGRVAGFGELKPATVADLHESLISKSLISVDLVTGRFRILETVKQYASEKLAASGAMRTAISHHRSWCVELATAAGIEFDGPTKDRWFAIIEAEMPNLRVALQDQDQDPSLSIEITGAIGRYWYLRGRYFEGRELIGNALRRDDRESNVRGKAAYTAGCLAYGQGDYAAAKGHLEEALQLHRKFGDLAGVAGALNVLGNVANDRGDLFEAKAKFHESISLRRQTNTPGGLAIALANLGNVVHSLAEYRSAIAIFEEALEIDRKIDNRWHINWCLIGLGNALFELGDYFTARAKFEEALALSRDQEDLRGIAWSLHFLGKVEFELSNAAVAYDFAEESIEVFVRIGDQNSINYPLIQKAILLRDQRDFEGALKLIRGAQETSERLGIRDLAAEAHAEIGNTERERGDLESAMANWSESLRIRMGTSHFEGALEMLAELAIAASDLGDLERSATLWGAVDALRIVSETGISPRRRVRFVKSSNFARSELGETLFQTCYSAGMRLDWVEAADLACRSSSEPLKELVKAGK